MLKHYSYLIAFSPEVGYDVFNADDDGKVSLFGLKAAAKQVAVGFDETEVMASANAEVILKARGVTTSAVQPSTE